MAAITQPETEAETEAETEDQTRPWNGAAGVGELTSRDRCQPWAGGRRRRTGGRTDQLRALGLDPDQVLEPQTPVGGPPPLAELTKFLKGPRVATMDRDQQLATANAGSGI